MPRARKEWLLDPQVTPTRMVSADDVREAMAALQIQGSEPGAIGTGATGKALVAIVKHLARSGVQGDPSVLTTPPSILCQGSPVDPERPTKENPVPYGATSLRSAAGRRDRSSRAR